jgi:hypothetical protein
MINSFITFQYNFYKLPELVSVPGNTCIPHNLSLISPATHVPAQAWQKPPGSVEPSRIRTGPDVCRNVHVSIHITVYNKVC